LSNSFMRQINFKIIMTDSIKICRSNNTLNQPTVFQISWQVKKKIKLDTTQPMCNTADSFFATVPLNGFGRFSNWVRVVNSD
jgi:hypothetical protein